MMAEVCPACISAPPYRLEGDELIIQNNKREKKLVQCGRVGCAARALMSCDVAESSEHTLDKLLSKLQQADLPEMQPLADLSAGHNFKKGHIMHIVNNISKGTTPGMDGNRAEFYKHSAATPSTNAVDVFQRAYNRFVNVLVQGAWPEAISLYFSSGRAILLIKEASKEALRADPTKYDIRQLNLMLLDHRIVGKCLLDKECDAIAELLNPFQLGVGVAGGTEAIMHATNMLRDTINRKMHTEVDLDLQNAYGRYLRQTAIDSVVNKLPGMARFVAAIYTQASRLYYEDHVFSLTSGID
jgi:hypothetical protein